jgi:hypothetical protein
MPISPVDVPREPGGPAFPEVSVDTVVNNILVEYFVDRSKYTLPLHLLYERVLYEVPEKIRDSALWDGMTKCTFDQAELCSNICAALIDKIHGYTFSALELENHLKFRTESMRALEFMKRDFDTIKVSQARDERLNGELYCESDPSYLRQDEEPAGIASKKKSNAPSGPVQAPVLAHLALDRYLDLLLRETASSL